MGMVKEVASCVDMVRLKVLIGNLHLLQAPPKSLNLETPKL